MRVITTTVASRDIGRVLCLSKPLWQYPSTDEDIVSYTNSIIAIASTLLGLNNSLNADKKASEKEEQEYEEELNLLEEEKSKKKISFFSKKEEEDGEVEGVDYTVDKETGRKYSLQPKLEKKKKEDEE